MVEEEKTFSEVGTPFVVILVHLRKKFGDSFESDFSDKVREREEREREREKREREKRGK